jgi:hypothetical protein
MSKRCNVQQLWEILQTAEVSYYNDNPDDAARRLAWVAKLAALIAKNGSP